MSLFRPYKYKPKPDLLSDAPVKHGFFLFWEIFFRKFWRFVTINMIYFVITLPMLIYFYYQINSIRFNYYEIRGITEAFQDIFPGLSFITIYAANLPSFVFIPLLALSIFLYGPATMGMSYIFRNFSREEHAWVSDIFSRGKANFKQGLFFGLLDVIIVTLLVMGYFGGVTGGAGVVPLISVILKTLSVIVLIFYLFMRNYFYTMAVTIDLNVFHILKNSVNFVFLGFFRNIWSGLVCLIAFVVSFLTVPVFTIILIPFIYYSFTGFATVFTCYPVIKKYIVIPALEQEAKKNSEDNSLSDSPGESR